MVLLDLEVDDPVRVHHHDDDGSMRAVRAGVKSNTLVDFGFYYVSKRRTIDPILPFSS